MNKTIVATILMLSVSWLIAWNLYLQNGRYELVSAGGSIAYMIDRKTGRIWTVIPGKTTANKGP